MSSEVAIDWDEDHKRKKAAEAKGDTIPEDVEMTATKERLFNFALPLHLTPRLSHHWYPFGASQQYA